MLNAHAHADTYACTCIDLCAVMVCGILCLNDIFSYENLMKMDLCSFHSNVKLNFVSLSTEKMCLSSVKMKSKLCQRPMIFVLEVTVLKCYNAQMLFMSSPMSRYQFFCESVVQLVHLVLI